MERFAEYGPVCRNAVPTKYTCVGTALYVQSQGEYRLICLDKSSEKCLLSVSADP